MTRPFQPLLWLAGLLGSVHLLFSAQAEHVVVVVWDGMRPDFVSAPYTPTLHELARQGTFFAHHHSSYITSTEVNGAAIATGMYPDDNGVLANVQYRPDLSWLGTIGTESFDAMRRADFLSDGHYLAVSTVAEILQEAGIPTVIAGAKPVVLLQDRAFKKTTPAQQASVTLFRGQTIPRSVLKSLTTNAVIGAFPSDPPKGTSTEDKVVQWLKSAREKALTWLNGKPTTTPLARQIDAWTTRAVIHGLWKQGVPKYTLLWLSEPDASQHQTGVGSPNAEVALGESDRNLTAVVQALKDQGVWEKTDLLVVSDHAFSTVERGPDLIKLLKGAHFVAGKEFENPEAGDVLVVNLGGSSSFYVFDHDAPTIQRLVEFLQGSDFAGVIFSALPVEGTFPLTQAHLSAARGAPDVVVSMRWRPDANDWGAPGLDTAAGGTRGTGTHASLSRFDLHNTLVAVGPDIKQGFVSELPSGNVDVAPTVLALLGVAPTRPFDGRVLTEAFRNATNSAPADPLRQVLEASRDLGFRTWHQTLKISRVGSVIYYDEGNGESRLK